VTDAKPIVLEMRGITKQFPGILANDHVDLDLRVVALQERVGSVKAGRA